MRAARSAKFAEYLSTYAILEHIGIHPTTLIEKRDAAVGVGVYVRDACDAGTALFVVPSRRFCSKSVLSRIGVKARYAPPSQPHCGGGSSSASEGPSLSSSPGCEVQDGIIAFLTGYAEWPELAWRLALEQHRSVSPLWGWLQSLPSIEEMKDRRDAAERQCRVHHTMLLPYYLQGRERIRAEVAAAYAQLRADNVLPPFQTFTWSVDILLSRSLIIPTAWPDKQEGMLSGADAAHASVRQGATCEAVADLQTTTSECGVVPFLDLVNAPDDGGRAANAEVEVAASLDALPAYFKNEVIADAVKKGRDGSAEIERLLQTNYYLCLTLTEPLRAAEEVIMDWPVPALTTGVLPPSDDALVSRLLKLMF